MSAEIVPLIDKATSTLLLDIDWDTTLQIVDMIRQGDVQAKGVINALIPKIHDSNPNVVILALQVLESVTKNCGQVVHELIATRDFMDELREVMKDCSNEDVQKKVMLLLATWVFAFRSEPKYKAVQDAVNLLKIEGHKIPSVVESDAMFTADSAPNWADGGCCHRCRSNFTLLRRKHHCRACGQVFCNDCSSKASTIPKFGIEREVRVCEHCHDEINSMTKGQTAKIHDSKTISTADEGSQSLTNDMAKATEKSVEDKKKEDELKLKEEEDLQLALALSMSAEEEKMKTKFSTMWKKTVHFILKSADTTRIYSGILQGHKKQRSGTNNFNAWKSEPEKLQTSPPHARHNFEKDTKNFGFEEQDPELAKYLNRSFWEQKRSGNVENIYEFEQNQNLDSVSPQAPSAPFNKISNYKSSVEKNMAEVDDFLSTLKGQLEIFVNRMKSNRSRGRPISNDTMVQSLFINITAMHSQLLTHIQNCDRNRMHYEQLQDKISQIRDAHAALDALREEHREKLRREKEEQDRIRQMQMMQKLEIMRKKKQEYLEYQRQLALHRMAESERQILSGQTAGVLPGHPPQPGQILSGQNAGVLPGHPMQPVAPNQVLQPGFVNFGPSYPTGHGQGFPPYPTAPNNQNQSMQGPASMGHFPPSSVGGPPQGMMPGVRPQQPPSQAASGAQIPTGPPGSPMKNFPPFPQVNPEYQQYQAGTILPQHGIPPQDASQNMQLPGQVLPPGMTHPNQTLQGTHHSAGISYPSHNMPGVGTPDRANQGGEVAPPQAPKQEEAELISFD